MNRGDSARGITISLSVQDFLISSEQSRTGNASLTGSDIRTSLIHTSRLMIWCNRHKPRRHLHLSEKKNKKTLVSDHVQILSLICSLKPKGQSELIQSLKRNHIDCISEVFNDFLKKKLRIDNIIIKRLKRFRHHIKTVSLKKTLLKNKKKILTSCVVGGILFVLLPLAVSAFSSIFRC